MPTCSASGYENFQSLTVFHECLTIYPAQYTGYTLCMLAPAVASEANAPRLDDREGQVAHFQKHSYVVLPGLLDPDQIARLNAAIDVDREANPFLWWFVGQPNNAGNLLLTQPAFELAPRLPVVLELLQALMGGPVCFEELSVQVTLPSTVAKPTGWHRDTTYWPEHPLRLDFPQLICYLADVDETTHAFTISPEDTSEPILDEKAHIERGGTTYFHGKAGTGILFNAATVHGATVRETENTRRILQVYWGHEARPNLSDVSLIPPRLWRDDPDPEVRRFYSKHSRYSRIFHQAMGIDLP